MFRLFTFVIVVITLLYTTECILTDFDEINHTDNGCPPLNCKKFSQLCPYGYQRSQDGCEICKCYDPCNPPGKPMICGANSRCFVKRRSDGTFATQCGSLIVEKDISVCELRKAVGRCKGLFRRFYYNVNTQTCEQFIYGGCHGNGNNFRKKDECESICINHLNRVFI